MKNYLIILFVAFSLELVGQENAKISEDYAVAGLILGAQMSNDNKYLLTTEIPLSMMLEDREKAEYSSYIWDIKSSKRLRKFTGHPIAMTHDVKYVATFIGNKIVVKNAISGNIVKEIGVNSKIYCIAFTQDNKTLVTIGNTEILQINCEEWTIVKTAKYDIVNQGPSFKRKISPNGQFFAYGSILIDLKNNTIHNFEKQVDLFILNDNYAAYDNYDENEICFINLYTLNVDKKFRIDKENVRGAISPNGGILYSKGKIIDINTNSIIHSFEGYGLEDDFSVFSNDGTVVLTEVGQGIKLFDINNMKYEKSIEGHSAINIPVNITNNNILLANSNQNCIRYWNQMKNVNQIYNISKAQSFDFDLNGDKILVCTKDSGTYYIDINTHKIQSRILTKSESSAQCRFIDDNHFLYLCEEQGIWYNDTIRIYNLESSICELQIITTYRWKYDWGDREIKDIKLSLDRNKLLILYVSDMGSGIELVNLKERQSNFVLYDEETERFRSIDISPNEKYFISGKSLFEYETGKKIKALPFDGSFTKFSNDGNFIYTVVNNEIIKYNLWTEKEISRYTSNSIGIINNLSVINNEKHLFTTTDDNTYQYWDVSSNELLFKYYPTDSVNWVAVSPDGRFDGTPEGMKYLYFVKGFEIITLESMFENYFTPNLISYKLKGIDLQVKENDVNNLNKPPVVRIIKPKVENRGITYNSSIESETKTIEITIEVTDQGGGIDEILLYHNGKLLETTNRGFKLVEKYEEKSLKTFTINLTNGDNRIKVTAFNLQRIESIPAEIIVNYTSEEEIKPNLYLLVIGINEYTNTKYNLNYAIEDAVGFKRQIEIGAKDLFNSIVTISLSNSEATKERIMEEIDKIQRIAQQQDMFVFYYAGHGAMSVEDKSIFYLIPTDVTQMFSAPVLQEKAISATELKKISTEIKAQKQMFILDACQSGGIEDVLAVRGAAEEKAIAQLARSTGTYWLAASSTEQFAGEFSQLGHGIFTYCILQAFTGLADGQGDNKITVQELSAYLNDQVPIISKQYKGSEQYPVTYGFGQDFPIILLLDK